MARSTSRKRRRTPREKKELYTKADIARARKAFLDELRNVSGGTLIRGCCTQGCCEEEAQEFSIKLHG
jgi:hypothetical protein